MAPRADAPSVEVPLNMLHLLRAETTAFQEWMGAWLGSENKTDSGSSVALLKLEIQAYEGWITAWLDAATSDDAPTAIPLPPSIPVTAPALPASSSQVLSTSQVNPLSKSSRLSLPKPSSSVAASFPAAAPAPGNFLQFNQSVADPSFQSSKPIRPSQTSFQTVTSQKLAGGPSSAPLVQTSRPPTVTPVPIISTAPPETPAATSSVAQPNPSGSPGSKGFNAQSDQNLAVYYGQSPATAQTSLNELCQDENVDIVIIAFLTEFFGPGGLPKLNFGSACGGQTPEMESAGASGLLHCPDLASQISQCQSLGKKVLLSLGGSLAVSAFDSDAQASQFASTLWDLFGAGSGVDPGLRPFGDVTIDGFDVGKSSSWTCGNHLLISFQTTRITAHQATAPLYPPFALP